MNALTNETLVAKIENVLETMCFVMADPIEATEVEEAPSMKAWIRFENEEESGCLQLAATLGFVQEAASGLLGVDAEDIETEVEAQETLLELANVIGGEVVALLGGEDVYFQMGLPTGEEQSVAAASEFTSVAFDSMGEVFCVEVERGAPVSGTSEADAA